MSLINIPINTDIAIWSYWKKHRPEIKEYHITADETAAQAMRESFKAMKNNSAPLVKTVSLNADPVFAKRAGNSNKAIMAQIAIFKYVPNADPDLFAIHDTKEQLLIDFGANYLDKLIEGMDDILNEYGGYAIGDTVHLTFWWWNKR